MFDTTGTLIATAFNNAWLNCALTAQSIENILVSLDTNGATGITLGIHAGTNACQDYLVGSCCNCLRQPDRKRLDYFL